MSTLLEQTVVDRLCSQDTSDLTIEANRYSDKRTKLVIDTESVQKPGFVEDALQYNRAVLFEDCPDNTLAALVPDAARQVATATVEGCQV